MKPYCSGEALRWGLGKVHGSVGKYLAIHPAWNRCTIHLCVGIWILLYHWPDICISIVLSDDDFLSIAIDLYGKYSPPKPMINVMPAGKFVNRSWFMGVGQLRATLFVDYHLDSFIMDYWPQDSRLEPCRSIGQMLWTICHGYCSMLMLLPVLNLFSISFWLILYYLLAGCSVCSLDKQDHYIFSFPFFWSADTEAYQTSQVWAG